MAVEAKKLGLDELKDKAKAIRRHIIETGRISDACFTPSIRGNPPVLNERSE